MAATAATRSLQGSSALLADLGNAALPPKHMATPTLALLVEATAAASAGSFAEPMAMEEPLAALVACVKLLGRALDDPTKLTEVHEKFCQPYPLPTYLPPHIFLLLLLLYMFMKSLT